jgi:hypothetical protein
MSRMTETGRPRRLHGRDRRIYDALAEAGIIRENDYVRRVIIDINVTHAVVIHVERYGDEPLLDVIRGLDGAEILTGTPAENPGAVMLTADELLLLRQRLSDMPPGPAGGMAVNSALDAKLFQAQQEMKAREQERP